jgi:hypothetical protein
MLRLSHGLMASAALLGLAACTVIVDGDDFTGGDGGITVDDSVQLDLIAEQEARIEAWCDCFSAAWNFSSTAECVGALTPPQAYSDCLVTAFLEAREVAEPGLTCQLELQRQALTCEQASACAAGEFAQCGFDFTQELFANAGDCFPEGYNQSYFQDHVQCARDHVVGSAAGGCPGDALATSTAVGRSLLMGNHFDFTDSNCHIPGNQGTADVFLSWTPEATGPVVIDSLGTTYDTILYVAEDCDATDSLACNDDIAFGSGITVSRIELEEVAAAEELLVVLEGWSPVEFGAARINFTTLWCLDEAPNYEVVDGEGQLDISSAIGPAALGGTVDMGSVSRFDPVNCAEGESADAPEAVLAWRAPAGGTYQFDTEGSGFDTILYLRRTCDLEVPTEGDPFYFEDACNDDDPDGGDHSRLTLSLMAEETILIVVDTKDGGVAANDFQVNIQFLD